VRLTTDLRNDWNCDSIATCNYVVFMRKKFVLAFAFTCETNFCGSHKHFEQRELNGETVRVERDRQCRMLLACESAILTALNGGGGKR
jgi:hypothetical protein